MNDWKERKHRVNSSDRVGTEQQMVMNKTRITHFVVLSAMTMLPAGVLNLPKISLSVVFVFVCVMLRVEC